MTLRRSRFSRFRSSASLSALVAAAPSAAAAGRLLTTRLVSAKSETKTERRTRTTAFNEPLSLSKGGPLAEVELRKNEERKTKTETNCRSRETAPRAAEERLRARRGETSSSGASVPTLVQVLLVTQSKYCVSTNWPPWIFQSVAKSRVSPTASKSTLPLAPL